MESSAVLFNGREASVMNPRDRRLVDAITSNYSSESLYEAKSKYRKAKEEAKLAYEKLVDAEATLACYEAELITECNDILTSEGLTFDGKVVKGIDD
jgi:hypothetical protein